jgi:hypothetical protein
MKNYNVVPMKKKSKSNLSEDQIEDRIKARNFTKKRHNQRGVKVFNRKPEVTDL